MGYMIFDKNAVYYADCQTFYCRKQPAVTIKYFFSLHFNCLLCSKLYYNFGAGHIHHLCKTMNTKSVISSINDFFNALRLWFYSGTVLDGKRYINRFKFLQVNAFVFLFILSFVNYLSGLTISYIITAVGAVFMIGVDYFIVKSKFNTARLIIAFIVNGVVIAIAYAEGTSSGVYLFFFVFLIATIFLGKPDDGIGLLWVYAITLLSILVTFMYCPENSSLQKMSLSLKTSNFYMNVVLSFVIGGLISYSMLRDGYVKEAALISKQQFSDAVYNTSLDAVFIVDTATMRVDDCNQQSLLLFEATEREQIIGSSASLFFDQASSDGKQTWLAIVQNSLIMPWKGEFNCFTRHRTPFSAYVSVVPLTHEDRQFTKINILDISDIKKAKNDLIEAKEKAEQAAAVKSRFLSNISHELRTPLNGIIGTTHLLLQESYSTEQEPHLDVLKYSSEHMLNLVNDVLDFSKLEAGKMQLEKNVAHLQSFIEKTEVVFRSQFEKKGLLFFVEFDPLLAKEVITDFTRLNQVLNNLLSNALKFTSQGGVKLSVRLVASNSQHMQVEFAVLDTGIGIAGSKVRKVFESFTQADVATTRKYGGTGLGLSISYKLVELLGGKLSLESEPQRGSRFHFVIPLVVQQQRAKSFVDQHTVRSLTPLTGMKILVAEDNPVNMMITTRFLQKWGIEITQATDGRQALEIIERQVFDLLLVDLEMPEIDGFGVVEAVRNNHSTVPVIAFTAAVFSDMKEKLHRHGFNGFLQKPFKPEDLHQKIMKYYHAPASFSAA
jgi:signal transduction histidine kinase/CheY-like chemotaxis protein